MRAAAVAVLVALAAGAYWGTGAHAAKPTPKPRPVRGCAFAVGQLAYVFVDMPGVGKVGYVLAGPQLVQAAKVPAARWPCGPDDPRAA